MKYSARILLLLGLAVTPPVLAETPKTRDCKPAMDAPLVWKPTEEIAPPDDVILTPGVDPSAGARVRMAVRPLTDARENPKRIGEHPGLGAGERCIFPVITRDDPAAWATDRIRILLAKLGFTIVESDGDVIISGELQQFFVREDSTYDGKIGLKLDVVSKSGKPLWTGLVRGSNGHWGRTFKLANHQETLSDAMIDAVKHLVADPSFTGVLSSGKTEAAAKVE